MLRHLILALFLIGLSLPAIAVSAHAEAVPTDCHGARPANAPHHKPDGDTGKTGHFCIGCVASPALPAAKTPPALRAAAPVAQPMTALTGANAPPSVPPPRS